jgi:hypothetical protein
MLSLIVDRAENVNFQEQFNNHRKLHQNNTTISPTYIAYP